MDFKVLITDSALNDLREIVEFAARDEPRAAERLGDKLVTRALSLATLPERYALHDAKRGIRKMPLSPYPIYYTCDEAAGIVHVLHFWHGARIRPDF